MQTLSKATLIKQLIKSCRDNGCKNKVHTNEFSNRKKRLRKLIDITQQARL